MTRLKPYCGDGVGTVLAVPVRWQHRCPPPPIMRRWYLVVHDGPKTHDAEMDVILLAHQA